MTTLPTVITSSGLQPQTPAYWLAQLLAIVSASNPGYTANLPGSLIEDISSTDTGALLLMDSARVDLVNSLTPYGINEFLLNQLGQIVGVQQGGPSNTSVYVVFTGTVGFVIPQGFIVSDGANQYSVQDGGVVQTGGSSAALFCLAVNSGTWAVPAATVTTLITSVPGTVTLSVTNPTAGTPGLEAESPENYRARVLQAGLAASQGMPRYLRTLLANVPGVQSRLISIRSGATSGTWEVICGGNGDPYAIAYAIFKSLFDITSVAGSTLEATAITQASPGAVTTNLNHGYSTGQHITIAGSDPTNYNGTYTITVTGEKTFTLGVDTSGFPAYVSGAVITPNLRNVTTSIVDYPDTYAITFVNPPSQAVTMTVEWSTISTNIVPATQIASAVQTAVANYINSIYVGQPINELEMQSVFQESVASIVDPALIIEIAFTVSINGIVTAPTGSTSAIYGDPESYFSCSASDITVTQV